MPKDSKELPPQEHPAIEAITPTWHKYLYSSAVVIALSLAWFAAWCATSLPGIASNIARIASNAILALYVIWMFAIIWMRDSKDRWLSLAIIVEWIGVAMLYLPVVEIHLHNGKCAPALEVGKAFELAGLFFGLTATIWLAAGAWLTIADVRGLNDIGRQDKWRRFVGGLLQSAHRQITLGLVTAILGVVLTVCSAGWDFYVKVYGVEQAREQACTQR